MFCALSAWASRGSRGFDPRRGSWRELGGAGGAHRDQGAQRWWRPAPPAAPSAWTAALRRESTRDRARRPLNAASTRGSARRRSRGRVEAPGEAVGSATRAARAGVQSPRLEAVADDCSSRAAPPHASTRDQSRSVPWTTREEEERQRKMGRLRLARETASTQTAAPAFATDASARRASRRPCRRVPSIASRVA